MDIKKCVLDVDDQFEINCRDHLNNMVKILKDKMEEYSILFKLDEFKFEKFVKKYSSECDKMEIKYINYLKYLETEQIEYE